MRKRYKIPMAALGGILLCAVLGVILPRWGEAGLSEQAEGASANTVRVLSNPIHTDIALPLDDTVRAFAARLGLQSTVPVDHPDARWLIIGWGSEAFYTQTPSWSELKPGPLLRAFTLDSSVLHVQVAGAFDLTSGMRDFAISTQQRDALLSFIENTTQKDEIGAAIHLPGAAYGNTDAFYKAYGYFNALLGCNTWTAQALRKAGITTGWWNPLPQSLVWSLDLHN